MQASDYIQSIPRALGIDPATWARLIATAWPDADRCTGSDLSCRCSWHRARQRADAAGATAWTGPALARLDRDFARLQADITATASARGIAA